MNTQNANFQIKRMTDKQKISKEKLTDRNGGANFFGRTANNPDMVSYL
jgi:hypothetical protein